MKPLPLDWLLRSLHTADEEHLQAFFQSHTDETVYRRYGYPVTVMSRQRAHALVGVDQQRDVALGIFEQSAGGSFLHAVGRYYTESADTAEMAFVVRETQRRRGLATRLLKELAEIARRNGLVFLKAQVSSDNFPMRHLVEPYRPRMRFVPFTGTIEFLIAVDSVLGALAENPRSMPVSPCERLKAREPSSPLAQ